MHRLVLEDVVCLRIYVSRGHYSVTSVSISITAGPQGSLRDGTYGLLPVRCSHVLRGFVRGQQDWPGNDSQGRMERVTSLYMPINGLIGPPPCQ